MLPVMLDVKDRAVLIAGGGRVALRKAKTLLAEGADVTVVSPKITSGFKELNINYIHEEYSPDLLRGKFIVIAATDSRLVNAEIISDAVSAGVLCMSVSDCVAGDFISMAYERSGMITAAVSTGGCFPKLARKMRHELRRICEENAADCAELSCLRLRVIEEIPDSEKRGRIMDELMECSGDRQTLYTRLRDVD